MGEIKAYRIGLVTYLFEARTEIYSEPPEEFGLTKMVQCNYIPEPGSIAVYDLSMVRPALKPSEFQPSRFPKDGCRKPTYAELKEYEELNLI